MKYRTKLLPTLLVGTIISFGCDGEASTYELASQPEKATMTPSWIAPEHYGDVDTYHQLGAEATALFLEKVHEHQDDWFAFDKEVRAHLDQVPSKYRYIVDQYLARKALEVLPDACQKQCDDSRQFYTELLLASGSPDAAFAETAIQDVERAWTEDEIKLARVRAADNAERWLEAQAERDSKRGKQGCREGDPCFEFADPMTRATARIEAATQRLREES